MERLKTLEFCHLVTNGPSYMKGLKILVSAVRFCPWPFPLFPAFGHLAFPSLVSNLRRAPLKWIFLVGQARLRYDTNCAEYQA